MDPGTIINVVTLVVSLLDLIRQACNRGWARASGRRLAELQLFCTQLEENLLYVKDIKAQADAVGFKPKSLEKLQSELQKLVSKAEGLFNSKGCKKEDIRELRELAMGMLQDRMQCILIEMDIKSYETQSKAYEELKAIKEMMAKKQDKQEMMSKKHGMHINICQEHNPILMGSLSSVRNMPYPTETLWERISRVLVDAYLNRVVPTEASKDKASYTYAHLIGADTDMVKRVEESGRSIKKGAAKDVPEEEEEMEKKKKEAFWTKEGAEKDVREEKEKNKLGQKNTKLKDYEELEGAGKDVIEEKKKIKKGKEVVLTKEGTGKDGLEEEEEKSSRTLFKVNLGRKNTKLKDSEVAGKDGLQEEEKNRKKTEALLEKDKEKQGQRTTELITDDEEQDNPNRNMELTVEKGEDMLLVSKHMESQFKMTYKWCGESMGMVIGTKPMEVSEKLGYFYFEVQLVKMAELLNGKESRLAGVGVGLTRLDKFRTGKMAGKYSKSCGYDGRVGEVYYENRVQGTSKIGYLAEGDTLGIGLLQHGGELCIFFAKNGVLRLCIQDHSLGTCSRHGGLYPVISLASAHVQIHVNFHGPFQISELLAQVKATLPDE